MHDDIVWNSRIYVESEVSYCIRQQLEQVPDSANDKNKVLRLVSNFKGSKEIKNGSRYEWSSTTDQMSTGLESQ